MIRIILAFIVCAGLFHFGIMSVREMTNKERWSTVKSLGYATGLATLTVATLSAIVLIF